MASNFESDLSNLLSAVGDLDASALSDGVSSHYLEFRVRDDECVLFANPAGLVHLARVALQLAAAETPGSHQTLDEAGMLDECDRPLTVALKEAPWA